MRWFQFVFLLGMICLFGCAGSGHQSYYLTNTPPAAVRIAIIPPRIVWEAPRKLARTVVIEEEDMLAGDYQLLASEMLYYWAKRRDAAVEVQPPAQTNDRLESLGFFDNPDWTDRQLADTLGVAHLLRSECTLSQPGGGFWGFMSGATLGTSIADSRWVNSMQLIDAPADRIVWDYRNHTLALADESPLDLLRRELRRAVKRMPYFED